jgi:hypothetical protein
MNEKSQMTKERLYYEKRRALGIKKEGETERWQRKVETHLQLQIPGEGRKGKLKIQR